MDMISPFDKELAFFVACIVIGIGYFINRAANRVIKEIRSLNETIQYKK